MATSEYIEGQLRRDADGALTWDISAAIRARQAHSRMIIAMSDDIGGELDEQGTTNGKI